MTKPNADEPEQSVHVPSLAWRPIETAPKDGAEIIGVYFRQCEHTEKPTIYGPWTMEHDGKEWAPSWDCGMVIDYMSDFGIETKSLDCQPTHWMPMPSPPNADTRTRGEPLCDCGATHDGKWKGIHTEGCRTMTTGIDDVEWLDAKVVELSARVKELEANAETRPIESGQCPPPAVLADPPQSEAGAVAYQARVKTGARWSGWREIDTPIETYRSNGASLIEKGILETRPVYASPTPASGMVMVPTEDMVRLSASEAACYRWPKDTAEHRACRAAYMDGAASMVKS